MAAGIRPRTAHHSVHGRPEAEGGGRLLERQRLAAAGESAGAIVLPVVHVVGEELQQVVPAPGPAGVLGHLERVNCLLIRGRSALNVVCARRAGRGQRADGARVDFAGPGRDLQRGWGRSGRDRGPMRCQARVTRNERPQRGATPASMPPHGTKRLASQGGTTAGGGFDTAPTRQPSLPRRTRSCRAAGGPRSRARREDWPRGLCHHGRREGRGTGP